MRECTKKATATWSGDPWLGHYFADWSNGLTDEKCQRCGVPFHDFEREPKSCFIAEATGSVGGREEPPVEPDYAFPENWAVHPANVPIARAEETEVLRFRTKADARAWYREHRNEGCVSLCRLSRLSECEGPPYRSPTFQEHVQVERVADWQTRTLDRMIVQSFSGRDPRVGCVLADDWPWDAIRARARLGPGHKLDGYRIESFPKTLIGVAADVQDAASAIVPNVPAEALADMCGSWQLWAYLGEVCHELIDNPEAHALVERSGRSPHDTERELRDALDFVLRELQDYAKAVRVSIPAPSATPAPLDASVRALITTYRREHGRMTVKAFARLCGTNRTFIQCIQRGDFSRGSAETLERVAEVLGLSADHLRKAPRPLNMRAKRTSKH